MKCRLAAAAIFIVAFGGACAADKLQADQVESAIASGDIRGALKKYFDCAKYEGTAYEAIATGSQAWVSIAARVLPMSDACYAEGIVNALGQAMQRKPQNVLPLVGKTDVLSPERICLPSISDELPLNVQREELLRSKSAISGVEGYLSQKNACLRFIASIEQQLAARR